MFRIAGVLLALSGVCIGGPFVLYDGAQPGSPASQGSLILGNTGGTETVNAGSTNLNTTGSNSTYAGYSNYNFGVTFVPSFDIFPTTLVNPAFPSLDRTNGFTVHLTMQLLSESHSGNPSRAGFSLIALGNDQKGIELGFQDGNIFAQSDNPLFVAAENTAATTNQFRSYDLYVMGNTYSLYSGNSLLLSGAVRDYSAQPGFASSVYRTSNMIFAGDDTTSAQANTNLAFLAVETTVPEPGAPIGLVLLLGAMFYARRFAPRSATSFSKN